MTEDNMQPTNPPTNPRQKIILVLVVIAVAFGGWMIYGMFKKSDAEIAAEMAANNPPPKKMDPISDQRPMPAKIAEEPVAPAVQSELTKMQQATQKQYVEILNELQMLKLNQQIVETNKDIATAKLATVKAQKDIVDLLTPKSTKSTNNMQQTVDNNSSPNQSVSGGPANPLLISESNNAVNQAVPTPSLQNGTDNNDNGQSMPVKPERKPPSQLYEVVSVTQLLSKWNAVLAFKNKLFSVSVGDVVPGDGSTVIEISRTGVTLEHDGIQRRVSMVPII